MSNIKSYLILLNLIFCLFLLGCGNNTSSTSQETKPTSAQTSVQYPPLPVNRIRELGNSTVVDFIFYQLPISMNLNEPGSIQRALSHLSLNSPTQLNCKSAIGRIFYQKEGETLIEADIFFEKGCAYLIFLEDGKAAFANSLSPVGIQFLQGSIQQATGILIEP